MTLRQLWCWLRTGHRNRRALGSVMRGGGQPYFLYACHDCGRHFVEPWT